MVSLPALASLTTYQPPASLTFILSVVAWNLHLFLGGFVGGGEEARKKGLRTMQKEEVVAATATAEAPESVNASEFEEFSNIEVTGNFRGYWRDVPVKDENGKAVVENGQAVKRRQFKITRSVKLKLNGKTVRQAAWLSEADAKAHNLVDGAKYNLTLSVGEELKPSKTNGQPGFPDEYSFADATIVSVNSK